MSFGLLKEKFYKTNKKLNKKKKCSNLFVVVSFTFQPLKRDFKKDP